MNVNFYVNKIVRKIKCGAAKRKEIKKELLTDVELRLEQGEQLTDIISQMGSIKEIADGFNENISKKEKSKYIATKIILSTALILFAILFLILLAVSFLYKLVPKSLDIENSEYFNEQQVEDTVKQTIILLDDENYTTLQENSIEQMKEVVNDETMTNAKAQVADDWGKRQSFGEIYMSELVQNNEHYVIAEIAVSYEHISVVYRLTYDTDMKLAGIYLR